MIYNLTVSYSYDMNRAIAPIFFTIVSGFILFMIYALIMTFVSTLLNLSIESGILIFYISLLGLFILPTNFIPENESKTHFMKLCKLIFFPATSIHFTEVLFADALTSLSKVCKDFCITLISFYAYFTNTDIVSYHYVGMILVALFASFPFWVRIRQCWIQYVGVNDSQSKISILLNIIKYFSAFPSIWIAAAASLGYFHPNLPTITAIMASINSIYGFLVSLFMYEIL